MQGMDCIDGYSFPGAEFLGVCGRSDPHPHHVGEKRLESSRSIFVLALPSAVGLGSGPDDWSLVSNRAELSFASYYLSTHTNSVAIVEASKCSPNIGSEDIRDFITLILSADGLCIPATRECPGRSSSTDLYGLLKTSIRDFFWLVYPLFCDKPDKY